MVLPAGGQLLAVFPAPGMPSVSHLRLSGQALAQTHGFLLDLQASHDPAELRTRITGGLSRLIACDRASFNEADLSPAGRHIVPTPTPSWWPKFGEVYQRHMTDHPQLNRHRPAPLLHTLGLSDARHATRWKKSALRNEYFLPLDITHQLSAKIHEEGDRKAIVSLNRHRRDFSRQERALLTLVNPHIALAWHNALTFTALREQLSRTEAESEAALAAVAIDARRGTIRSLSPAASRLLRHYFFTDTAGGGRLPESLARWLAARRAAATGPVPSAPLVVRQAASQLTISPAALRPDETVLLLRERHDHRLAPANPLVSLSPREGEILGWIIEGKRNSEISVILGISLRTVEKHVEHILMKLGVETRGAAIRMACERTRPAG